jgi:hypothetical protein
MAIPFSEYSDLAGLIQQTVTVKFGEDLSDGIYNITNAVWAPEQYATWPEDQYHTYAHDVYETDASGALVYTVVPNPDYDAEDPTSLPNLPQLTLLHSAGDPVLDGESNPILKYAAGEIRRDANGDPIVLETRTITYYVQTLMLDARLYASRAASDIAYLQTLTSEISTYVRTVSALGGKLLEQTDLYFRPLRTIGNAVFSLGNSEAATLDLGLSFSVRYYVRKAVMDDESLKKVIEDQTKAVIETHTGKEIISATAIASELKALLSDRVESIDALGINNNPALQTLIVLSKDAAPMVALKLAVNQDGSLGLKKDISIAFAVAE